MNISKGTVLARIKGGRGTPLLGVVDNDFYFAGQDLSDGGKQKVTTGVSVEFLGSGGGHESVSVNEDEI